MKFNLCIITSKKILKTWIISSAYKELFTYTYTDILICSVLPRWIQVLVIYHYELNHEKPDMFRYAVEKELIK